MKIVAETRSEEPSLGLHERSFSRFPVVQSDLGFNKLGESEAHFQISGQEFVAGPLSCSLWLLLWLNGIVHS